MENAVLEEILLEETYKYANHYFEIFEMKIRQGIISYKEHYESDCEFDTAFFEGIIFREEYFSRLFQEKQEEYLKSNHSLEEAIGMIESYKKEVVRNVQRQFEVRFAQEYISKIDEIVKNYETELDYAREDERYYSEREYIQDEDSMISEDERVENIAEAKQLQEELIHKISIFDSAKSVISSELIHLRV